MMDHAFFTLKCFCLLYLANILRSRAMACSSPFGQEQSKSTCSKLCISRTKSTLHSSTIKPPSREATEHNPSHCRDDCPALLVGPLLPELSPLPEVPPLLLDACDASTLATSVSHTSVDDPSTVVVTHDPMTRAPAVGVAGMVT